MNPSCVSPTSASTLGDIRKSLAYQQIPEGAAEGTYSFVHRGSTLTQCDASITEQYRHYRVTNIVHTNTTPLYTSAHHLYRTPQCYKQGQHQHHTMTHLTTPLIQNTAMLQTRSKPTQHLYTTQHTTYTEHRNVTNKVNTNTIP